MQGGREGAMEMEEMSLLREKNGLKMKLREDNVKCLYSGKTTKGRGRIWRSGEGEQDPEKRMRSKDEEKQSPKRGENFIERLVNPTEGLKRLGNESRPLDLGTKAFFLTLSLNRLVRWG